MTVCINDRWMCQCTSWHHPPHLQYRPFTESVYRYVTCNTFTIMIMSTARHYSKSQFRTPILVLIQTMTTDESLPFSSLGKLPYCSIESIRYRYRIKHQSNKRMKLFIRQWLDWFSMHWVHVEIHFWFKWSFWNKFFW